MFVQYHCKEKPYQIKQGEAGPIYFSLIDEFGKVLTPESLIDISIVIGNCEKRYSRSTIEQNSEITFYDNMWLFWLTQYDSYRLEPGLAKITVFIKKLDGTVPAIELKPVVVVETESKVIL